MRTLAKLCAAALMSGGGALATATPANAQIDFSIGIGGPAYYGYYDYTAPCWWYREYELPAPRRCYPYFYDLWGPGIFFDGDFIFRDRDDFWRWRDRDDYRHWREHDFHWRSENWQSRGNFNNGGQNWNRSQSWSHGGQNWNSGRGNYSAPSGPNPLIRGQGQGSWTRGGGNGGGHHDRGGNGGGHWDRGNGGGPAPHGGGDHHDRR